MAARVSVSVLVIAVLAGLVTAAALFGAWQLHGPSRGVASANSTEGRNDSCLRRPCPVPATAAVGGRTVRLHATRDGSEGALELPGMNDPLRITVTDVGAHLGPDSLVCVDGPGADGGSCLVRGGSAQGEVGEVFVDRHGSWDRVERPFVSSAGVLSLRVIDGVGSVVAAQRDCATADCGTERVYAQVFDTSGTDLGCTQVYGSKYSLPGWPQVAPRRYQLDTCPQS